MIRIFKIYLEFLRYFDEKFRFILCNPSRVHIKVDIYRISIII